MRTAFNDRLSSVRDLLSPAGRPKLDNLGLTALLDLNVMEALNLSAGTHSSHDQCSTEWKLFTLLRYIDIATAYARNYNIGWQAEITSTYIVQYTATARTEVTPNNPCTSFSAC